MVNVEVLVGLASTRFSGICQAALGHLSGSCFKVRVNGLAKPTDVFDTEYCIQEVAMTTRADGTRRIATANATIATLSAAGVVGLSVMLAQQGTHHTAAAIPTAAASTTQTRLAEGRSESSSDDATTTVTTTPQTTVQQAPVASVQHAVTSGS